ncbi:MAG: VacJ family lipoprotein [Idiomarina sp.]|nr:VacJ family lipoprotein [Idiomarina sp.]
MKPWFKLPMIAILCLGFAACSSTPNGDAVEQAEDDQMQPEHAAEPDFDFRDERDPFEGFNRRMWSFNRNILDPYLVTPAATAYSYVPGPLRWGLYNMTENLTEPASAVNNLLQGKGKSSLISASRFVLNSTVGLFGFFDVATEMGLEQDRETFGETLAIWGTPDGPYVMLPGFGPTVVIDRGGDFVDDFYSPAAFFNIYITAARFVVRGLEQRLELREVEPMLENSLDEYAFVRDVYFSYWQDKVYDGEPPRQDRWDQDLDDWDDWDDEGWAQIDWSHRGWENDDDAWAWQSVKRQR